MPSKEIAKREHLEELVDRLKSIIAERKFNVGMELIQMKHEIGHEIVNDPLYVQFGKGTGELVKQIAEQIDTSDRDIYYCIEFYKKFPKLETAIQTIAPEQKGLSWRAVLREIGPPKTECQHSVLKKVVWTIVRKVCRSCGFIVEEKKEKEE